MTNETATQDRRLDDILTELQATLSDEREALKRLDRPRIEQCAIKKLELGQAVQQRAGELGQQHREALRGLSQALRFNQVLLVHARDQVRGLVDFLQHGGSTLRPLHAMPAGGARLDLRG
jgi:hypothetical protein